jgi:hypothetical protein
MAKPKPKPKGKAAQPARKGSRPAAEPLPSDDELDAFQKQRNKISLDAFDDGVSGEGLDEEAVYDLSDEDEDFDSDDEDEIEAAIAKGGDLAESELPMRCAGRPRGRASPRSSMPAAPRACSRCCAAAVPAILQSACRARCNNGSVSCWPTALTSHPALHTIAAVARQAKLLGQKLKLQQKEDEDDGDEADDKADDKTWGASKKAYYADGDEYDVGVAGWACGCCCCCCCCCCWGAGGGGQGARTSHAAAGCGSWRWRCKLPNLWAGGGWPVHQPCCRPLARRSLPDGQLPCRAPPPHSGTPPTPHHHHHPGRRTRTRCRRRRRWRGWRRSGQLP